MQGALPWQQGGNCSGTPAGQEDFGFGNAQTSVSSYKHTLSLILLHLLTLFLFLNPHIILLHVLLLHNFGLHTLVFLEAMTTMRQDPKLDNLYF